jgi:hypothetical protein
MRFTDAKVVCVTILKGSTISDGLNKKGSSILIDRKNKESILRAKANFCSRTYPLELLARTRINNKDGYIKQYY